MPIYAMASGSGVIDELVLPTTYENDDDDYSRHHHHHNQLPRQQDLLDYSANSIQQIVEIMTQHEGGSRKDGNDNITGVSGH